ncbi:family 43 glycosylhydrolase [Pelagicoccus albus]|uniref:Family 43 glycosylhydrolase n=1 Tax=Pelagicoccus albus TaxID=415222 RepID=A0A7X1EB26_9BACT|nr:family 43 glycosylhydrolase [Pelagicoccus albus]MBC2607342.1 family 43 glycosylhydrolase [Pelagicoccus albus]
MNRFFKSLLFVCGFSVLASCHADEPADVSEAVNLLPHDVVAHDPVIIKDGETFYLFTTGPGVTVWKSEDLKRWTMQGPIFDPVPEWTNKEVAGFQGHMWAPDISYHDGKFYLYYSVSTFGKNNSCIGLATNTTLDPENPSFKWVDEGIVVQSKPDRDDWNAIDPNLILDEDGTPYLAFGSFWSGLKIAELNADMTRIVEPEVEPLPLASRVKAFETLESGETISVAGNTAIEGPFIYKRGQYFYLFASIDFCCRGLDSTYRMIYGRSEDVLGPYVDKQGHALLDGGGSLLKSGDERWQGVGHNAVCELDGVEYVIFHGYDGNTERGLPKLHIEALNWTEDGWPELTEQE